MISNFLQYLVLRISHEDHSNAIDDKIDDGTRITMTKPLSQNFGVAT